MTFASKAPEKGLSFSDDYFRFIIELKKFNFAHIYNHWRLKEFAVYASNIIETIYRTLMRTFEYARHGRIHQALKYYPTLEKNFELWLVKYAHYSPNSSPILNSIAPQTGTRAIQSLRFNTEQVFNLHDIESFSKCIIEFISGMSDIFAIQIYEEIISF